MRIDVRVEDIRARARFVYTELTNQITKGHGVHESPVEPDHVHSASCVSRVRCQARRRFTSDSRYKSRNRYCVAKVEFQVGELFPRVGFIVTHLACPAGR
jgi:hypothetical protein